MADLFGKDNIPIIGKKRLSKRESMDIEEDFGPNLLMRMKRFAMIILDNQIKYYVIDERGDYGKTDAENIITVLKNIL